MTPRGPRSAGAQPEPVDADAEHPAVAGVERLVDVDVRDQRRRRDRLEDERLLARDLDVVERDPVAVAGHLELDGHRVGR